MQIDARFIQKSHVSSKRLRSSVSPSPLERPPQKRVSMGLESNAATPSYTHHTLPEDVSMNENWSTDERGRSEDWVAKTSGLRLNSPSLSTHGGQWLHTTPLPECKEWNLSTNTDTISHSTNTSLLNSTLVSESLYDSAYQKVVDIDIDVHMNIASSLLTSKESIGNIPSPSGLWLSAALTTPLPQSPRKSKLKMGRRADCDKCRLGVKGHWIHID